MRIGRTDGQRKVVEVRRWACLALAVLQILFTVPGRPVLAETTKETAHLAIDVSHIYDGMEQPFSKGYEPVIKGDTMTLVVPFLAREPVKGNKITVAAGFHTEKEQPFYFKNYQKRVRKTEENLYLYRCKISLKKERINGAYPVILTAAGETRSGEAFTETFPIYVEITDGKTAGSGTSSGGQSGVNGRDIPDGIESGQNDGEELEEGGDGTDGAGSASGESHTGTEEVVHQPKLLLESSSLADQSLEAGESYPLSVSVRNCSKTTGIENVKVVLSVEVEGLTLGKNVLFYDSIAAAGAIPIETTVMLEKKVPAGMAALSIVIEYEDAKGNTYSDTETLNLRVIQRAEAMMTNLEFPNQVYGEETDTLTLQIQNTSLASIQNLKVTMEGEELMAAKEFVLGELSAGTLADVELPVYAKRQDAKEYEAKAAVVLTYEDETGQVYTQTSEVNTTILRPQELTLQVKEKQKTNQWSITIVILVILLLLLLLFGMMLRLAYYKRKVALYKKG